MTKETPVAPGSLSVADALRKLAGSALVDNVDQIQRAQGRRGIVTMKLELCLGDQGQPLWTTSAVYFEQKRHIKDARGTTNDEA